MSTSNSKMARLEARITPAQKRLIAKAASIQGRTVTQFVVDSAQQAAKNVVQEDKLIALSTRDSEIFVKALLNAPVPSERLMTAVERYKSKIS
jgi:uncharacterized protein (DUF1778 family)